MHNTLLFLCIFAISWLCNLGRFRKRYIYYNGWCRYDNRAEMSTAEKNTDAARVNANIATYILRFCTTLRSLPSFIILRSHSQRNFAHLLHSFYIFYIFLYLFIRLRLYYLLNNMRKFLNLCFLRLEIRIYFRWIFQKAYWERYTE